VLERIAEIEKRLCILQGPDPKSLERFQSLKSAYEDYKIIEKLVGEDE